MTRNHWLELSNDIRYNQHFDVCVHHDNIVLINRSTMKTIYAAMFNINTHTFQSLPRCPFDVTPCRGTILHGYLYVTQLNIQRVYRLDLYECKHWEFMGHFQQKSFKIISTGNNIFSFGILGTNWVYHFISNKWERIPRMSIYRDSYGIVAIDNKIYIIGGYRVSEEGHFSNEVLSSVEVYDAETRKYTNVTDLPIPLGCTAAAVYQNRWIVVTGGKSLHFVESRDCYIYDTQRLDWASGKIRLRINRCNHGCAVVGDQIILVGGVLSSSLPNSQVSFMESIDIAHILPNWYILRHFILLRWLVDRHRAHARIDNDDPSCHSKYQLLHLTVNQMMLILDMDPFRAVLSFLIPR